MLNDMDYMTIVPVIDSDGVKVLERHLRELMLRNDTLSVVSDNTFANGTMVGLVKGMKTILGEIVEIRKEVHRRESEGEKPDGTK